MGKRVSYPSKTKWEAVCMHEISELEQLNLRVKQLEMHNELLGKLNVILRK